MLCYRYMARCDEHSARKVDHVVSFFVYLICPKFPSRRVKPALFNRLMVLFSECLIVCWTNQLNSTYETSYSSPERGDPFRYLHYVLIVIKKRLNQFVRCKCYPYLKSCHYGGAGSKWLVNTTYA